jgi:hypothetical protein
MTIFLAAALFLLVMLGVGVLLEQSLRRTAGLPRAPFGADLE